MLDQALPIRMVCHVASAELPEDAALVKQEQVGQGEGVTLRPAANVAFRRRSHRAGRYLWRHDLAQARSPDAKGGVERLVRVGDGPGLGPQGAKEVLAVLDAALVDEQDRRIVRGLLRHLAQVRDGLAAKRSAKVAQEDKERGRVGHLVSERAGAQVDALDGLLENKGRDGSGNGLSHMNVLQPHGRTWCYLLDALTPPIFTSTA